jgi:flagellar P-ring protein precursor FlgI
MMLDALKRLGAVAAAALLVAVHVLSPSGDAQAQLLIGKPVRVKDIGSIQGARNNFIHGIGLVVGLEGTGDSQSTGFSERALLNFVRASGLFPTDRLRAKNVAVVSVDSRLPPFIKPGQTIDVTVSSIGDAKNLTNGVLIPCPLKGPDDKVYAVAQGPLSTGGFGIEVQGSQVKKNATLVARIPNGALIEREVPVTVLDANGFMYVNLVNPDFITASRVAAAVGKSYLGAAQALDAATIRVYVTQQYRDNLVDLVARLEGLEILPDSVAKVVIEERTGTVILGSMVKIDPVAVSHGNLIIKVETKTNVSQPAPFSGGQTQVTQEAQISATETKAKTVIFDKGTTLGTLVRALNALGTSSRDMITILQNIKAAGALNAHLELI